MAGKSSASSKKPWPCASAAIMSNSFAGPRPG
ncbi:Uncharacterised protein [Bordetella pertussis]|nr:Uncharacterised protein [Bordetella pertussis]